LSNKPREYYTHFSDARLGKYIYLNKEACKNSAMRLYGESFGIKTFIEKSAADELADALSDIIVSINDQCNPDSDGTVSMDYEEMRSLSIKALKKYKGE